MYVYHMNDIIIISIITVTILVMAIHGRVNLLNRKLIT